MKIEYAVQIVWSQQDGAYLALCAELPGCVADGQTPEEALANCRVVIQEWIETAQSENRKIPPPMTVEDLAKMQQAAALALRSQIEAEVRKVVSQLFAQLSQQHSPVSPWIRGGAAFDNPEDLVTAGGRH